MQKILFCFLSFLMFNICALREKTYVYQAELKVLKASNTYKDIFDADKAGILQRIQVDIENYKELTYWQRFLRFPFFALGVIVVTPEMMPQLYYYVDTLCKQAQIKTPTIFITLDNGFFNAAAAKLLTSTGGIVIGQKLLNEVSDEELEGVIAHEIGHIKYNHVNKSLLISIMNFFVADRALYFLNKNKKFEYKINDFFYKLILAKVFGALIIGKRFEQQADEFAYKNAQRGEGLKGLFEHLIRKEEEQEQDFVKTYNLLQENKEQLSNNDYNSLILRYYFAKVGHVFSKGIHWLYHHTPFGAHPSPEERIKTIETYLAS